MAYNIFEWVKEVTERKGEWSDFSEEDKLAFNPWMLNKCLSMHEPYIELVSQIQKLWLLTHEQLYNVYKQFLPKRKIYYKYIKSSKPKVNENLTKHIAEYYIISTREAKQYLNLLSKEDQINILNSLGVPEEEINEIYGDKPNTSTKSKRSKSK